MLVPDSIRNKESEANHDLIGRCFNAGTLRRWNCVLFSVMWQDNYSQDLGVYPSQCKYLKAGYLDFADRIVDVGWLGRWWIMEKKMRDYDVSSEEWDELGRPVKPAQL